MDFDSHLSDVVGVTVHVVNLLTPGHRRGQEYPGDATPAGVAAAFAAEGRFSYRMPSDAEVVEMRGYTDRLHSVFAAVDVGDLDTACLTVNALMADTHAMPVLSRHGGEPWHLHFHAAEAGWAIGSGASMATSLAVVLGGPTADRLGICSASACDRVFADTSRNGTRRFCSVACQNRRKAAAFRSRRRLHGGGGE
ncbi:CGNR zinc finger domain-containing protein [Spiractinospora alimapuensis]|uniref:CGNR zinc finger domain-containing protein n=1 Tax=Spiractinospora alimapuensis TaxID=2820884 RepID=UPI001F21D29C|nr:CGNR zinc finger domain-containing protein [Spiractinospora alimapuensis]QVQ50854.1 CGNR zinc finger domain-containing protein [Spiractinospora alimapuensis]